MKKFLLFVVVFIAIIFIGFTAWYFIMNNENILLTIAQGETIYLNKGEIYEMPITWNDPHSKTTVFENVTISNKEVISYDIETKTFVAINGGVCFVTVTPSNEDFGPFNFEFQVGAGTKELPFNVRNEKELMEVGKTETWTLDSYYIIMNNINMEGKEFEVIGATENSAFTGCLDGNLKTISNLTIKSCDNGGLFGVVAETAIVKNVVMENVTADGSYKYLGSIAGINYGNIINCNVKNFVVNNKEESVKADEVIIKKAYKSVESGNFTGGIVGANINTVKNNVFKHAAYIEKCEVVCVLNGADNFGGIAGFVENSIIFNCSAKTTVKNIANVKNFGGVCCSVYAKISAKSVVKNVLVQIFVNKDAIATNKFSNVAVIDSSDSIDIDNLFKNIYIFTENDKISNCSIKENLTNFVKLESLINLMKQQTYKDFDFENVWSITENESVAFINMTSNKNVALNEDIVVSNFDISNQAEFMVAIDQIKNNDSLQKTYYFDASFAVDATGWETLTTSENILKASFLPRKIENSSDEHVIIIKNFKITNDTTSFFGYIGSMVTIKNFVFENVTIDSNKNTNVGIVASYVNENAFLQNIGVSVGTVALDSFIDNLGFIVASNYGVIDNANVITLEKSTIKTDYCNFGGVAALNAGTIQFSNVEIKEINFVDADNSSIDAIRAGGISGVNRGTISNCVVENSTLQSQNGKNIYVYFGGISGQSSGANGVIEYTNAKNVSLITSTSNNKTYISGISALNTNNVKVFACMSKNCELTGYSVGGIAETSYGEISQCYADNKIKGYNVGGISAFVYGKLHDCYVNGSIEAKEYACGMAYKIFLGCDVQQVYVACDKIYSEATAVGIGEVIKKSTDDCKIYYDTSTTVKKSMYVTVSSFFGDLFKKEDLVEIEGFVYLKNLGDGILDVKVKYKYDDAKVTEAELNGTEGNYSKFTSIAKFSSSIWNFKDVGKAPTLKNVLY